MGYGVSLASHPDDGGHWAHSISPIPWQSHAAVHNPHDSVCVPFAFQGTLGNQGESKDSFLRGGEWLRRECWMDSVSSHRPRPALLGGNCWCLPPCPL